MRIILTKTGSEIFQSMSQDAESLRSSRAQKLRKTEEFDEYNTITESQNTIPIKFSKRKYVVPKHIQDIYNSYNDTERSAEHSLIPVALDAEGRRIKTTSFKGILKKNVIRDMKDKAVNENALKMEHTKHHFKLFRTPSKERRHVIEDIDYLANKTVNPGARNIITFLNKKPSVSTVFLQKITSLDKNKLTRLDKICHRFMYNKEMENITAGINKDLDKKEEENRNYEYKESLKKTEVTVNKIKKLSMRNYEFINRDEKYKLIHQEFKDRFWQDKRILRLNDPNYVEPVETESSTSQNNSKRNTRFNFMDFEFKS
jgi:hypothetical protein